MGSAAVDIDPRLITFVLPSIPEAARMARFHIRAALSFHGLSEYADDAEIIASELVTNAVQHVSEDPMETIGVTLARVWDPAAVAVIVTDSSPEGPVRRETSGINGRGRGLQIVEALSVHWDWNPENGGKAVYAILASEE